MSCYLDTCVGHIASEITNEYTIYVYKNVEKAFSLSIITSSNNANNASVFSKYNLLTRQVIFILPGHLL